ncbi:hypothetical protein C7974DRAFT_410755 [Boeremia exigua]|uniref:uncharacterized protein n=1 Tax=Boeremia exigua TaxID=749465 RepID=UPI001E8D3D9B|nr:uncharacterized protein C7974DRAFT_410755 [Boeremia exigua]KAH6639802.1 hypothetical protein C7974DRAFT_410755 [Boeremia exigua]
MSCISNDRYTAGLLPTFSMQGNISGARLRQTCVEDAEGSAGYAFESQVPHKDYHTASEQPLEWHGVEITPMLGAVVFCVPFALWSLWIVLH